MSSPRRSRKALIVITLMAALSFSIIGVFLAAKPEPHFSNPEGVRPWTSQYDDTLGTLRPMPPAVPTPVHPPLGAFDRIDKPGSVRFISEYLDDNNWEYPPPPATFLTPDNPLPLSGGRSAALIAIGVSYPTSPSTQEFGLFHPVTLEPMKTEDLPEFARKEADRSMAPRSQGGRTRQEPEIFMAWDEREADGLSFTGTRFFDARTHEDFKSNSSFSRSYSGLNIMGSTVSRWQDGAFIYSVDYVDGKAESGSISPKLGEKLVLPKSGFEMQINQIETVPNLTGGYSWGEEEQGARRIEFVEMETQPGDQVTLLMLSVIPPRDKVTLSFELKAKGGKTYYPNRSSINRFRVILKVEAPLEELTALEVTVSNPAQRVAYTFPRLPGLPPENEGLTNLFDTRIPYLDLAHTDHLSGVLEQHAQLRFRPGHVYFASKKEYYDVTLNDLFEEIRQNSPDAYRLKSMPATYEIQHRETFIDSIKAWLRNAWPF